MKTYKKEYRQVEDRVYCDICGNSCSTDLFGGEYATIEAVWGYGSKHDGEKYDIQICEGCFFETVRWMKSKRLTNLNIENHDAIFGDKNPFEGKPYNII
jgi:hypothetical protein